MAKVSRSVLKEIVKECLLEILFEGIDSEPGYAEEEPIREARQSRRASRPSNQRSSKRSLHAAVEEQKTRQKRSKRPPKQDYIQEAVGELTDDPMMASIFADTASTTLQEQKEGARPVATDTASQVVAESENMEDLFEGASNWAAIAFNDIDS